MASTATARRHRIATPRQDNQTVRRAVFALSAGVSPAIVGTWRKRSLLPVVRKGRHWHIDLTRLHELPPCIQARILAHRLRTIEAEHAAMLTPKVDQHGRPTKRHERQAIYDSRPKVTTSEPQVIDTRGITGDKRKYWGSK